MEKGVDNMGLVLELEEVSNKDVDEALEAIDSVLNAADVTHQNKEDEKYPEPAEEPEEEDIDGCSPCAKLGNFIESIHHFIGRFISNNKSKVKLFTIAVLFLLYNVYFVAAIVYQKDEPIDWCDGVGFLIIVTSVVYVGLIYFQIVKRFFGRAIYKGFIKKLIGLLDYGWVRWAIYLVLLAGFVTFLVIDTESDRNRLFSFLGLIVFLLFGWIFSKHPSKVVWKQVIWGIAMQFIFGLIVLRWDVGRNIIDCLGDKVTTFLAYTDAGSSFVYGHLVTDDNSVFAFKILSVTFFFSFSVSILYYYGAMQWVVKKIGWGLQVSIGTTAAESTNAAANIFLGQTEAPLIIRPYLPMMTKSELHAVMTGGFATIAGTVLAAYISFGINAANLLSASIMSAPAALAFSKLFYPESEKSKTGANAIKIEKGKEANALDAAAQGAATAVFLVANIIANLIAFLAFVEFLNGVVSWLGGLLGASYLSFEYIMGKIFIPVAWLMGVPTAECDLVASLVALKTIVNEFAAYAKLSEYIKAGTISKRSETIATYALCGFSNPGSIGSAIAAMGTMAPSRKSDLARVAIRAFIAGNVACFLTACIAGTLIDTTGGDLISSSTEYSTTVMTTLKWAPNITRLL